MPDLPDPRAMERPLHELIGDQADPATPRGQAEDLVAGAFEQGDPRRRVELARQALALWPDCADALVLLAENAATRKEALQLYQQAVAAGERALGPDVFQQSTGRFWGVLQTRPYMRARLGLAHSLWTSARREEAVGHLQDMLRLNPNDNQGARYTLAGFLLFLDRDDELARLLDQYPDEHSAAWAYTKALLAYRHHGDTPQARQLLEEAEKVNRHVPDYLLLRKGPPPEPPSHYSPGQESEALIYIGSFLSGWKGTPGALAWLRANDEHARRRKAQTPAPRGPLGFIKAWLKKKLPQQDDVWQADCRRLPVPIQIGEDGIRPWLVLVISRDRDRLLGHRPLDETPTPAHLWDTLVQAMQNPVEGEPHRPTELRVHPDERWESLRPHLQEIGVQLVTDPVLDHLDRIFAAAGGNIAGKAGPPALLDVPGIAPEQVASFYVAAAAYFRQAPWKKVPYATAIRVECAHYQGGPWFAVPMGQSGLTWGLALYDDWRTLEEAWTEPARREATLRKTVATTLVFGDEENVPPAEVEAARRHGWEVARPDAYSWVVHLEQGLSPRPPLPRELELLEACLRAVGDFVDRRPADDAAPLELTVSLASGERTLVLSWVEENPLSG